MGDGPVRLKITVVIPEVSVAKLALVRRTVADVWRLSGSAFEIEADISETINSHLHGPGVYTVVIFGRKGEESVVLTNYSVFVGIQPPHRSD